MEGGREVLVARELQRYYDALINGKDAVFVDYKNAFKEEIYRFIKQQKGATKREELTFQYQAPRNENIREEVWGSLIDEVLGELIEENRIVRVEQGYYKIVTFEE